VDKWIRNFFIFPAKIVPSVLACQGRALRVRSEKISTLRVVFFLPKPCPPKKIALISSWKIKKREKICLLGVGAVRLCFFWWGFAPPFYAVRLPQNTLSFYL